MKRFSSSFSSLQSNKPSNESSKFLGEHLRGRRFINEEVTQAEDALAVQDITDTNNKRVGLSAFFNGISDKVKMALGQMSTGGVGTQAWRGAPNLDPKDADLLSRMNSHFSANQKMDLPF